MVERREDPAASTAMFRAYLQRGNDDDNAAASRSINPMVWVAVAVVLLVAIVVGVMLVS